MQEPTMPGEDVLEQFYQFFGVTPHQQAAAYWEACPEAPAAPAEAEWEGVPLVRQWLVRCGAATYEVWQLPPRATEALGRAPGGLLVESQVDW